jgi:hypothetical protein
MLVTGEAELATDFLQLGVQILPLPNPQEVQVLLATQPPEGVAGQRLLRLTYVVPKPEQRQEVAG